MSVLFGKPYGVIVFLFAILPSLGQAEALQDKPADAFRLGIIRRALAEDEMYRLTLELANPDPDQDDAARQELLSQDETLDVLAWLGAYVQARADVEPTEMMRFSSRLRELPVPTAKLVLTRLRMQREQMRQRSADSLRWRRQAVARSRRLTHSPGTARTAASHAGALSQHYGNSPYEASRPSLKPRTYHRPEPLISSRTVAAFAVYRMIFPRW